MRVLRKNHLTIFYILFKLYSFSALQSTFIFPLLYAFKTQKNIFNFFEFFSKKLLTFSKSYVRMYEPMERWLSWSKAHDWKSCLG